MLTTHHGSKIGHHAQVGAGLEEWRHYTSAGNGSTKHCHNRIHHTRDCVAIQVLKDCFLRAGALDGSLNALTVTAPAADLLQHAGAAGHTVTAANASPVCGLPVAVKDCIHVKGLPTRCTLFPKPLQAPPAADITKRCHVCYDPPTATAFVAWTPPTAAGAKESLMHLLWQHYAVQVH